jgi:prostatic aicd phosphatase
MLHSAFALLAISHLAASQSTSGETVHGVVIFSRHGDRTWKGAPPTALTVVGQNQLFNSGEFWHSRYLNSSSSSQISGISPDSYDPSQLYASAPDEPVLVTSGQAFLQGLYPPDEAVSTKLANGTTIEAPLGGYQYAPIHTVDDQSAQALWLKGDDSCPSNAQALSEVSNPDLEKSTKAFYQSFYNDIFAGVMPRANLSYANAYSIFDYINVGVVHNDTIAKAVSSEQLFQLRTLADSHEWALNGNFTSPSDPLAVGGRTLASKILQQLENVVTAKGASQQFSLLVSSYDSFLTFFSLTDLEKENSDFFGLPDYGSAMVFELFSQSSDFPSSEKDLSVRFLFRNGTTSQGDPKAFPLFQAASTTMSYPDFKSKISGISIKTTEEWCASCGSPESFCFSTGDTIIITPSSGFQSSPSSSSSKLTPTQAGVVGAMVTLAVFGIATLVAALAGFRFRKRRSTAATAAAAAAVVPSEKHFDEASSAHVSV